MITIRGYYQSVTNYECHLELSEEEFNKLSYEEKQDLIQKNMYNGWVRENISEEDFGILYVKDGYGNFVKLGED